MPRFFTSYSTAFAAAATIVATAAFAETTTIKINLSGKAQVPPNDSKAAGTADVTSDTNSKKLGWRINYSGLTGPATMAHFHGPAEAGKNAPVVIPITPASSPSEGSVTLTDTQAADLMAGKMYINVHTDAHKGGEIRGQVTK